MERRLHGRVLRTRALSDRDVDGLYALFDRHYERTDRATFDRDLAEKDWVLALSDPDGETRGFTTMSLWDRPVLGQRRRVLYSGNTIIDPACWGQQELVTTWVRFLAGLAADEPDVPLTWFLICSGFRTYLYLPLFFRSFYPRWDRPTPEGERALIDALGRGKFPREYREGVIRVASARECLRPELARPSGARGADPHVRFFFERNPGWRRGDELACVTTFAAHNLRRASHRRIVEGAHRRALAS